MDAPDADSDVKLQKASSELIADLDRLLLQGFALGRPRARSHVKARETLDVATSILDLFQELPQLLDPHLSRWIPLLSDAFLDYCQSRRGRGRSHVPQGRRLVPLDHAVCRVLYALCKVRGEKVVLRFLNVEARYLEVLLAALEGAEVDAETRQDGETAGWEWEQRYVVLLWLSHLLLAPFDLSTISSVEPDDASLPAITGLELPDGLPGITVRLMPLAVKYLSAPGKERDAAKALLVRMAMRRDMQQLGVLDCLVKWALASLAPREGAPTESTFFYLGVLSFLAGVLRSAAETSDMDRYLPSVFNTAYDLTLGGNALSKNLISLALVRKMILKVVRSVVVSLLRKSRRDMASTELTETAIGYFLESLSDNDTPVRLSASKALSVITLKLDPDMASQVVEAVLDSLNRNVLWAKRESSDKSTRDLSAVNHLEWHGLMLTLSHLLYRRSPPATQLSDILHALILGLSFEQRGTSGASIGANVRDAACFGIWATARRYTSQELLAVDTSSVFSVTKAHAPSASILQVLATELVVTASLDPAGNIRRGASAALQELVGRHPDTVEQGIAVVQKVDYHAVARRSRAIEEVAIGAARLSSVYGEAVLDGILSWRGIGDIDAPSRRVAAGAFGPLLAELSQTGSVKRLDRIQNCLKRLTDQLRCLAKRQVEERHGLLLCFASVMDNLPLAIGHDSSESPQESPAQSPLTPTILADTSDILDDCNSVTYRKPELVVEGASRLIVSLLPMLQSTALPSAAVRYSLSGRDFLSPSRQKQLTSLVAAIDESPSAAANVDGLISKLGAVIPAWLSRNEPEALEHTSAAALILLIFSEPSRREATLRAWAEAVRRKPASRAAATGYGYFDALIMAPPVAAGSPDRLPGGGNLPCEAFLERWRCDKDVDTRVALLGSLIRSGAVQTQPVTFLDVLRDGLNDYTTTARGDVGSHVRVEALRATRRIWERLADAGPGNDGSWAVTSIDKLLPSVMRLSAEKLDRIRPEAQAAICLTLQESHASRLCRLGHSTKSYFDMLLGLASSDWLHAWLPALDVETFVAELLAGFVTSADTGNDDLVIASRAALTDFCVASSSNTTLLCQGLLSNLRTHQGDDRVLVSTLEVTAFLLKCGVFQSCRGVDMREIVRQTQKAGYKTGSVRKLMACVRVYGGVAFMRSAATTVGETDTKSQGRDVSGHGDNDEDVDRHAIADNGAKEARKRLGALMYHPWPRVRSAVVDELWGLLDDEATGDLAVDGRRRQKLLGIDWAKANREAIHTMVGELGLGA
ncbi:hypothetical protein HIM_01385 [Hirsutella minnesotensis 3608]|nr:hypothetical protein HIM_01385 [Hirsutella minnesotensis 3608]